MRRLAGLLLRALGLTRLARAEALQRDLAAARRRALKLEAALAESRAAATKAERRHLEAQRKHEDAVRRKLAEPLTALERHLADASRERLLTDGQLALVETKLDVIEGAIQALDTRTRELLMAREGSTPAQGA